MRPGDFKLIIGTLNKAGVRYLVIGGVAAVLHGARRATFDVDICLSITEDNLSRFWTAMADLGYKPRQPVSLEDLTDPAKIKEWREEKNLKAITFWHPAENMALSLDLVIDIDLDFEAAYARRKDFSYHGIDLTVASKDDVVKMKKLAGRSKDLDDVKALEDD